MQEWARPMAATACLPGVGPSPYVFDLGYDANGNRDTGGTTVGVANEISTDGTWNYTYDADGNLTEKTSVSTDASWTYAYNAANELTQVQEYGSSGALVETVDYKYDGFGEEIEQDVTPYGGSTTTTKFAYNGWNPNMPAGTGNANFQQIAILNSDDSLQTRNIEGNMPGQNLARVDESSAPDGGGVYFLLNDYQNSVQAVVDTSGNVKDAVTYNAFGTIESETDATYRGWYAWTGMETDQQTGLQYNNGRWYNAATGTWMTQDPLGFDAGDSNLYRYVNNAPTDATDPSGMAISEIPVSQIVLEYEKEFYQQKLASFTDIGNAAEKWAKSVANWKIKDGVNALRELFKTGKKFIAESKTAAELAFMSGFASVTDSFVVLGSKQNPDDRTKVKDVLQPRLDPGQSGDITVPHLGTIFGLKLTPQLASVEYSKNGSVAWCRLNLEAKFTFGILKDHTLNISPTGTWYGVTAQQDFKRNDKHFLVFSNNPEVKDGPAAAVFNWDTGKREGDRWDEMFFPDISLPKAKKKN